MGSADKGVSTIRLAFPAVVGETVEILRAAGGEVWVVGGAVRDAWLGRPTRDWDLATTLLPAQLQALLPQAVSRDARLGAFHLESEGLQVAVNTLREESGYRDFRHPDAVRFIRDPAQDARRRDFTVNALYAEPDSGRILDPCGGLDDLRNGRLRTIGDPRVRLREDPLRMLRAVRFAARTGLQLEAATAASIAEDAALVRELTVERVFDELTQAFTGDGRGQALRLLVRSGLAAELLPEVVAMDGVEQPPQFHPEGDVLVHTCLVLEHASAGDPVQAWAAVLHDIGKPPTFERAQDRIRFSGHDVLSARMARDVLRRLHAPGDLTDAVVDVCKEHIRFAALLQMTPGKRERWMRSPGFPAHLEFHRADCAGSHGDLSIYETARELLTNLPPQPPPPLVGGRDVLALGVPEGPMVGEILAQLQEQLDRIEAPDRATALERLRSIVDSQVKDLRRPRR